MLLANAQARTRRRERALEHRAVGLIVEQITPRKFLLVICVAWNPQRQRCLAQGLFRLAHFLKTQRHGAHTYEFTVQVNCENFENFSG
jgi:hypothetical protein